jgi:hypothetical protein
MFAREGLGCLLTLEHLIDVSPKSGLTFVPLSPALNLRFYLIWNRYQTFTPIAERFLKQVAASFSATDGTHTPKRIHSTEVNGTWFMN